jgi:hypothetical protein
MNVPVYPQNVLIRFDTRRCGGVPSDVVPDAYTLTQSISLSGVNIGTFSITDRLIATFDPSVSLTTPTNNTVLQSLISQFTTDFFAWGQVQFDELLAGIAAVQPNGLIKTIEFKYNSDICYTRISTQPDVFRLDRLTHQDPALETNCPSNNDNNTSTPCIKWFAPPVPAQSGSNTTLDEFLICFEDGRLTEKYLQTVTYNCGCGSEVTCCVTTCNPCPIPKQNLTISWLNVITGPGSTTLYYNGSSWVSNCSNGLTYQLLCTGGEIELRVLYYNNGPCPTGTSQYCSNLRVTPYGLTLASSQCNAFNVVFDSFSDACPAITSSGYTQFIVSGDMLPPPDQQCCIQVCVVGCVCIPTSGLVNSPVPGSTVTVTQNGQTVTTCLTGPTGCCFLNVGATGQYTITATYNSFSLSIIANVQCCGFYQLDLTPQNTQACCNGVPVPPVTLTDNNGSYSLEYSPISGQPTWTAIAPVPGITAIIFDDPATSGCPGEGCLSGTYDMSGNTYVLYTMTCNANGSFTIQRNFYTQIYVPNVLCTNGYGIECGGGCAGGESNEAYTGIGTFSDPRSRTTCNPSKRSIGTFSPSDCVPFSLSGGLTFSGSGLGDPVGGTVTVEPT